MKYATFKSSNGSLSGVKLITLGAMLGCTCLLSPWAYAQEDFSLVPGDEVPADVAANEQPSAAEAETQPKTIPATAQTAAQTEPAAQEDPLAEDPLVGLEDSVPTDELPGEESMAPEATATQDEFSFDDNVEYEKSSEEIAAGFRKQAFDAALEGMLPLKPDEIRTVLEHYDRTIQSTEVPVHPYPRPELTVQNVALDPGTPPLVVKLAFGYVTTLSILDITGKPWPIDDISWVGDFEIHQETPDYETHMLRISPSSNFAHGNVSMRLKGLETPVIMTFETNRDLVHYRFDAIIPKEGPNTVAPLIDPGPASSLTLTSGDVDMSVALGGVIPEDAEKLLVNGVDGRTTAYNYNGLTYVRTPLTLLSPGWESSVASADGTRVYALEQDAPVLILSDKGRMVRAYLAEVPDTLDGTLKGNLHE